MNNNTKTLIIYIISNIFLLLVLLLLKKTLLNDNPKIIDIKFIINTHDEIEKDNKKYPFFNYDIIDNEINSIIENNKDSMISYEMYDDNNLLNILFYIDNNKYKNINFDIKNNQFLNTNEVLDTLILNNEILELFKTKYSTYIYNKIVEDQYNNLSIKVNRDGFYLYINNSIFERVNYPIYVYFSSNKKEVFKETSNEKVIAFTFDDGPSNYTKNIVNTLNSHGAHATFFELGNRMKYNQEIVLYVIDNNMEVGSHTYAHKNLNTLSQKEIETEINSTNIIFNEITGKDIKLLRPPYGNANQDTRKYINMPLITWNIDTKDWLYRDPNYVASHIIENVKEGDIILMHDLYPETLEAIKIVLPLLKENSFKIVSVSELAIINNKTLENSQIYRNIPKE